MKLTLGFSPCPNDTFIFDALVNKKLDTGGLTFNYVLEDVETLNQWADEGRLDVTKLSYNSFLKNMHQYALLHSGSALGKGVGPLLVSKAPLPVGTNLEEWLTTARIAIPGANTTANLLLTLAFPNAKAKTEVLFSDIEQAVLDGQYDAGLIIHESRFTYHQRGLHKLADMGDWWEEVSGAAIPLGGIVIRRAIDAAIAAKVDALIRESLAWSWKTYPELSGFVKEHSQEMEEEVMRKHIQLYVNEYTEDLGPVGEQAIQTLLEKARAANLLTIDRNMSVFYRA